MLIAAVGGANGKAPGVHDVANSVGCSIVGLSPLFQPPTRCLLLRRYILPLTTHGRRKGTSTNDSNLCILSATQLRHNHPQALPPFLRDNHWLLTDGSNHECYLANQGSRIRNPDF